MKKTLLAALIAATALVPAAAIAQDRGGRWGGRDGGQSAQSGRQHVPQSRQDRSGWRPQERAAPQPRVERPQRQEWRQRGAPDGGSNWRQQRQQATPQMQQPQMQRPQMQQPRQDRPSRQWSGQRQSGTQHIDRVRDAERRQWGGDRDRRDWDNSRNDRNDRRWDSDRRRDGSRSWGNTRYGDGYRDRDRHRWNNNWRNDRRYDWRGYRASHRHLYRLPRYYAPVGWGYGYRRFSIGFTLSSMLFSQQYWINDPFYYRLPPAYGPYRWVRYYNDALLVDVDTGEVVDVMYDFFW